MTMSRLMSILRRRNRNAEVVTLTDWNSAGDGPLTAINRPDTLSPLTHRLPVRVPDPETLQKELLLRVDELAAAGALDEGCAGAFDRLLEEIGAQWNVALEADAVGRQTCCGPAVRARPGKPPASGTAPGEPARRSAPGTSQPRVLA